MRLWKMLECGKRIPNESLNQTAFRLFYMVASER
jgi:hypothetical protein